VEEAVERLKKSLTEAYTAEDRLSALLKREALLL